MHLNGEKCYNVICREKLAGNGQMDLRLMRPVFFNKLVFRNFFKNLG